MKPFGIVYLIWNMVNGKKYVGQTIQPLYVRFDQHSRANTVIGNAIRKYGAENFRYGVIKTCASKAEMDYWEKHFIAALKSKYPYGYNIIDGGAGFTDETRKKISIAQLGEKHHFFGKHHTAEQKAQIAAKLKGRKRPRDVGMKISATKKGKSLSAAHCSSLSIAKRGNSPYKNLIAEFDAIQMSYKALAELMGLSPANIARKMRGKRNFTERDKIKLEEIFGKPAEYLLQRDDE